MQRGIGIAAVVVIGCGGAAEPVGIVPLADEPAYAVVLVPSAPATSTSYCESPMCIPRRVIVDGSIA